MAQRGNEEEIQGQIGIIGFCAVISRSEWWKSSLSLITAPVNGNRSQAEDAANAASFYE